MIQSRSQILTSILARLQCSLRARLANDIISSQECSSCLLPHPPTPHFFPVSFSLFSINCLVVCFFAHPATTRGRWVGRDGLGIMRMTCNSRWRLRSSVRQWPKVTNEAGMRWSLTGQDEAFKDERYFLYAY